jgi:hypothetical protein
MKKIYLISLVTLAALVLSAQSNDKIVMKWKLKPGEVLTYKTALDQIDTADYKSTTFNFGSFIKSLSDSSGNAEKKASELIDEFNKEFKNTKLISVMTEQRKGIIDIAMTLDKKDTARDTSEISEYFKSMLTGVQLRGAVDEDGNLQSFYVKNDQRNLVALFFQLPGKPVKTGDVWSLDVHFISMDQNFKCDTSYRKNRVKLLEIKKEGNETIAVLNYDIEEFVSGDFSSHISMMGGDKPVKTMMRMTFYGMAEFSVDKGRWKSYNGIMSLKSSGVMDNNTTKRVSLSDK